MNNIIKITSVFLAISFIALLLAENFGYYKTKEEKAKILTEEQIIKFEEDIKNGKSIDITEYINFFNEDDINIENLSRSTCFNKLTYMFI